MRRTLPTNVDGYAAAVVKANGAAVAIGSAPLPAREGETKPARSATCAPSLLGGGRAVLAPSRTAPTELRAAGTAGLKVEARQFALADRRLAM